MSVHPTRNSASLRLWWVTATFDASMKTRLAAVVFAATTCSALAAPSPEPPRKDIDAPNPQELWKQFGLLFKQIVVLGDTLVFTYTDEMPLKYGLMVDGEMRRFRGPDGRFRFEGSSVPGQSVTIPIGHDISFGRAYGDSLNLTPLPGELKEKGYFITRFVGEEMKNGVVVSIFERAIAVILPSPQGARNNQRTLAIVKTDLEYARQIVNGTRIPADCELLKANGVEPQHRLEPSSAGAPEGRSR